MRDVPDLTRAEMAAAGVLSAGIVAIGFFPAPALALVGGVGAAISAGCSESEP